MLATLLHIVLATLTSGSPIIERQNSLQIVSNCDNQGQVALTFDDGPYVFERDIVGSLKGGKGTFFLNGHNYDCIYNHVDDIRYLDSLGHTIASHTWSHTDMTTLSYEQLHTELAKVEAAFIRILGKKPLYFRPPYGAYNNLVLQVAAERGYTKMILWSDDTGDASGASMKSQEEVMENVIQSFPAPRIVLQHCTIDSAPGVLDYAVPQLLGKGYQLVTVDTCLGGGDPYQYVGQPGKQDGSWTC